MATLLNGINEVLKRTRIIESDLASLTDSGTQEFINIAIQVWNEVIENVYSRLQRPRPNILSENTITLATDDRDYALQTDLTRLYFPFHDETNGQYISEYPGGYLELVRDQPYPANETGLPYFGTIRPTDGEIYLDKIPQATENGRVYKYRYERDVSLSAAADTFPFEDVAFRALVPAVAEMINSQHKGTFNRVIFKAGIGAAMRYIRKQPLPQTYQPFRRNVFNTDPFEGGILRDPFDA